MGNNVLYVPPSNIDGFLLRDTYVSSSHVNRSIWNKICDSSLLNLDRLEVFLSKKTQFSQGNKVIDGATSIISAFFWRDTCVSTIHLDGLIWNKMCISIL
jgi:hypothetical protein